jgi:hypothetical protein
MGVRQPLEGNRGVATPILTRLAWALGVVVVAILAATLLLIMGARGVQLPPGFQAPSALSALQFLGPAIVGAILAALRPRNPIGWLLLGLGLCFVTYQLVVAYLTTALFVTPAGLPAVGWVAWVGNWIWVPGHACIVLLFLLFPTGQLLSPRWRPVAWLGVGATALVLIAAAGYPGPVEVANSIPDANLRQRFENPLGMAGFLPVFLAGLTVVQALQVVGVVSLVLRLRRSRGEERQQIKWVAYAALLLGLETVALTVGHFTGLIPDQPMLWRDLLDAVTAFGLLAAIAVAVLKYRLYDIDLLINRTLVYVLLIALLAGVYTGTVLVLGQLFGGIADKPPSWVVAGATLAVAALFQPARRRIQLAVDRRFNRRRYDAAKTVEAFSARLRDEIELDMLSTELLAVVDQTVQPAKASLWLRPPTQVTPRGQGRAS